MDEIGLAIWSCMIDHGFYITDRYYMTQHRSVVGR